MLQTPEQLRQSWRDQDEQGRKEVVERIANNIMAGIGRPIPSIGNRIAGVVELDMVDRMSLRDDQGTLYQDLVELFNRSGWRISSAGAADEPGKAHGAIRYDELK